MKPSAGIVRVEALSLWRRANLSLANWSLEVAAWFARLLSESHGHGFDPRLVRGSLSRQKSQLLSANVLRGRISGWKIETCKYKCSTRSTVLQLRLHNFSRRKLVCEVLPASSSSTCAEQLAQSADAEQSAQSNFHRAFAQSSWRRATWAEQKSGCSVGSSTIMRVIARSHHDSHCIESSQKLIERSHHESHCTESS